MEKKTYLTSNVTQEINAKIIYHVGKTFPFLKLSFKPST